MKELVGQPKEFGFVSEQDGKPLVVSKEENYRILFVFSKETLFALENRFMGRKRCKHGSTETRERTCRNLGESR